MESSPCALLSFIIWHSSAVGRRPFWLSCPSVYWYTGHTANTDSPFKCVSVTENCDGHTHTHAHISGMHGPVMLQGHSSCLSRPWTTVTSVRFAISKSTRQVLRSHSLKKRSELKDLRSKKYILKNKTNIDIFILIYIYLNVY